MHFEFAPGASGRFDFVESTGSTNTDLVAAATANPGAYPNFSVLVTGEQTAGRGRAGREWVAPASSSLFVSVLLRPVGVALSELGWLSLVAGLSLTEAIRAVSSVEAKIKWPNDILINGKKTAGILSELIADQSAVVVGFGVNVYQTADQLPTETSTSLALEGVKIDDLDRLLSSLLHCLRRNLEWFESRNGKIGGSYLHQEISKHCETIGKEVKVLLPGDEVFVGQCEKIDDQGRVVVRNASETRAISVGDIVHLRHN
jgi:BirA family biotin operon repressor/biotin-[acetyl-CoA-carboxylase] ligase